jgi:hypothetical protein
LVGSLAAGLGHGGGGPDARKNQTFMRNFHYSFHCSKLARISGFPSVFCGEDKLMEVGDGAGDLLPMKAGAVTLGRAAAAPSAWSLRGGGPVVHGVLQRL